MAVVYRLVPLCLCRSLRETLLRQGERGGVGVEIAIKEIDLWQGIQYTGA